MALENTVAKYTVQIMQDGTAAPATAEFAALQAQVIALQKQLAALTPATHTATGGLHELKETSTLTRESTRLLNESIIFLGAEGGLGELAKGALLASEGMKATRTASILFKTELTTILPILGAVAAVVGVGVFAWRAWADEQQRAVDTQNELTGAMREMPELLKRINDATRAGALSGGQSSALLQSLGAAKGGGSFSMTAAAAQNTSVNAQLPQGYHVSLGQFGIPDAIDIAKANEELAKTGELLKIIDEQGKVSYVENPAIQAVNAQKTLIDQMNVARLDGFAKEKAQAELTYDAEIEKLKQIAQLEQFIKDPTQRAAALAGNASAQTLAGQARDNTIDNALQKTYNAALDEEAALWKKIDAAALKTQHDKQELLDQVIAKQTQLRALENQITEENLTGEARKQQAITDTMNMQIEQFTRLAQSLGMSAEEIDAWVAKIRSGAQVQLQSVDSFAGAIQKNLMTIQQLQVGVAQSFASGFANAFVSFASGTQSAAKAFEQFAAQILQQVAQMIIQMLVLRAIMGIAGSFAPGSAGVNGTTVAGEQLAASGGVFPRMLADGGFAGMVHGATYFPRFNVIGGEAGGEMMAALARPTFRSVGGIDAIVGNAGNRRLAIADAGDLEAGARAGGMIHIQIDHTPETRAEIISTSIKGATVEVTKQMRRNSPVSQAVKGLAA